MRKALAPLAVFLALFALAAPSAFAVTRDDKAAEEALKAIKEFKEPDYDKTKDNDQQYQDEWFKKYQEFMDKRSVMELAFYKTYPKHAEALHMLEAHWRDMAGGTSPAAKDRSEKIVADIDIILKNSPSLETEQSAWYTKAQTKSEKALWDNVDFAKPGTKEQTATRCKEALLPIDEFAKKYPKDDRVARLYASVAAFYGENLEAARSLYTKIIANYPNAKGVGYYKGKMRQMDEVGKPFALTFTDAITGKETTLDSLKGKVVMIDFWATWCGPCVAEMPEMKKLYADYHDKGLEIVGVSLDQPADQGGLDALKKYIVDNQIAWPQYYQGKGWSSEFSTSWGINSIPQMFLIDKKGNLRYLNARGGKEEKVKELLKED